MSSERKIDDKKEFKRMYLSGTPWQVISRRFGGVSHAAIKGMRARMKLPPRPVGAPKMAIEPRYGDTNVHSIKPGDEVRLETDHPLSNGKMGRVVAVEWWGCHLETGFGTGHYRAMWKEMLPLGLFDLNNPDQIKVNAAPSLNGKVGHSSPTGDPCPNCGGANLVRTGSCVTCNDCFHNEGCG